MEDLLNRGLNFSILPKKLDIIQVLVDFTYFEHTMIWKEFWFGKEETGKVGIPIFKRRKTNLPKNHSTPNQLKTFLGAVKSELTDSENRNPAKCNLPPDQLQALKELIQLQREKKIVIKKCDKGAGVIILDFDDYMKAAQKHLSATNETENGEQIPFYTKVQPEAVEEVANKIDNIIKEAVDNYILTSEEAEAMSAGEKSVGKFYMNFKVHKPHDKVPPERPIVSGCNSITSNIGKYVEFHMNEVSTKHPSYLQDTPDFLKED